MALTAARLRELGADETEVQSFLAELKLNWAREDLLRDHYRRQPGIPGTSILKCLDPQKYGTDCGKCAVCCSKYREGALEWAKKTQAEKREAMELLRNIPNERRKYN